MLKKISGKNLSRISVLLLVFISFQCDLRKPIAPTWDIQVSFPLINRPYTIDSLIQKDTSLIKVNPTNGSLVYSYSQETVSDSIGDKIKLKPKEPTPMFISAGAIPFRDFSTSVSIPNPGFPPGPTPIPSGNLPPIYVEIPISDHFDYLEFESGIFKLTVINFSPITIEFNDTIRIVDKDNNQFGFYIGSVPPNTAREAQTQLSNKTIKLPLKLDTLYTRTPGSITPVIIPDPILKIKIDFLNLLIKNGRAKIPPTDVYRVDSAKFVIDTTATPTKLKSAAFKQGIVDLKVRNRFDVTIQVSLSLPQLINKTNRQPFSINKIILRNDSTAIPVDFSNYEFKATAPTDTLIYNARIIQLGSEGDTLQFRTFNQSDQFIASLKLRPPPQDIFVVSYVEGIVKPIDITLDTLINLKLGDIPVKFSVDSLRFPDSKFILNLSTPDIKSRISGNIKLDDSAKYTITIPQKTLNPNSTTSVTISGDEVVSTLARYVSTNKSLPKSFKINASVEINPSYASGSISSSDNIGGQALFEITSNIGIKGGVFRDTLTMKDEKNDDGNTIDLDSTMVNRIRSGSINFTINNRIPLGSRLSLKLLDADTVFIQDLPSSGPMIINPSLIGTDGFASSPEQSKFTISLTKKEIDNINRAKFIALEVVINTVETAPFVKFKNTDWINFRVFGTFNYRVED